MHKIQIQIQGEVGFSQLDIRAEDAESEWKLFRRVIFVWYNDSILQEELSTLIDSDNSDIDIAFPNLPGKMYSNTPCAFSQLPDDVLEFGSGTSLQTPKEVQISFVIQFKFNSTFWRRKIRLDAQVDQVSKDQLR